MLSLGRCPEGDHLKPLCVAPVPQDPPIKYYFWVILGATWDPSWRPVRTNLALWSYSGGFEESFRQHVWSIWLPLGFDVILGYEE